MKKTDNPHHAHTHSKKALFGLSFVIGCCVLTLTLFISIAIISDLEPQEREKLANRLSIFNQHSLL